MSPTTETVPVAVPVPAPSIMYAPATVWRRLANFILDRLIFILLWAAIIFSIYKGVSNGEAIATYVFFLSMPLYVVYYLIFETIWQSTPGKWITRTKVVMRDGSKPPFLNILGRSFARIIPFEQLSFLFSKYPVGWHDSLSKTMVVPASYTEEDVKRIDLAKVKSDGGSKTALIIVVALVALLVIIAIIGILSSVVLVSLNTARQKGNDARTMSVIMQARVQMEVYQGDKNTYSVATNCGAGAFATDGIQQTFSQLKDKSSLSCYAEGETYAVSSPLSAPGTSFCVDSTGYNSNGVAKDESKKASCEPDSAGAQSMGSSRSSTMPAVPLIGLFHADEGSFSIAFQHQPIYTKDSSEAGSAGTIDSYLYQDAGDAMMLQAGYVVYPKAISLSGNKDEALTANMNGMVKGLNAKLVSSKLIDLDGNRAIDFTAYNADKKVYIKSRGIIVGQGLYMLSALYSDASSAADSQQAVDSFIASFKLDK